MLLHVQSSHRGSFRKAGVFFKKETVRVTSSPAFLKTWTCGRRWGGGKGWGWGGERWLTPKKQGDERFHAGSFTSQMEGGRDSWLYMSRRHN